jgi:hypothetical protein
MNKMNKRLLSGLAAAVLTSASSHMVLAASISTPSASAQVIEPMTIANPTSMYFGLVAGIPGSATTVVLDLVDGTTPGGGAYADNTGTSADFTIAGEAGRAYTLTLPASITLTGGPGPDMVVNAITNNATGTVPGAGTETFQVGGTLNIGAGQLAGTYSQTYTVTVNYQ